jgi:HlyD family secretion protein
VTSLRSLVALTCVGLLAGAAGFFGRQWLPAAFGSKDTAVASGEPAAPASTQPPDAVTALGRLEPESEIVAVGGVAGGRIERLAVKEGDYVASGAILAYLDSHAEMSAARDYARTQWQEARKRWQTETAYGQAAVEAAKCRLKQADEVALLGIQAQQAELRRSLAALDKAQLDSTRADQMLKDKAIPKSQYDSTALAKQEAKEQLEKNKATLAQLQQDRAIKIAIGRADLKSAAAALERAQVAAQMDSLAAALKLAEAKLDRTVIRAPLAGEIIKILTHAGESVGSTPILKMGSTRSMFVVAEIYETDIGRVHPGQKATITSRAFPSQTITGRVQRVSTLVHRKDVLNLDPTADADARVLEARIRLDDSQLAAHYNYLQVDVRIAVQAP